MAFPSDVFLPVNAKYYGFIETKDSYNPDWDLTWSFTFALTGDEHGFCTFLTEYPTLEDREPGQYLGYLGSGDYFLLTEADEQILTESEDPILLDGPYWGALGIGFDSTGYFALSNLHTTGLNLSDIRPNSLIVRDSNYDVVYNEELSSLSTEFFLASSVKTFQTLKFRLTNGGRKLYIDFKQDEDYKNLATISLSTFDASKYSNLYTGLTFCSPISSSSTDVSTLFLKNFNIQGSSDVVTYETIPMVSIYPDTLGYTSISGISSYEFSS